MSDTRSQRCSTCANRNVLRSFMGAADDGPFVFALYTIARCSECSVRLLDLLPQDVRERADEFRVVAGLVKHAKSAPATVAAREARRKQLLAEGTPAPSVRRLGVKS